MPEKAHNKPFVIALERQEETPDGHFVPNATLQLTSALRTSGLLLTLPAEEVKSLLLLLTFLDANGHIQPTLRQLADALHLSPRHLQARMQRLEAFLWQGKPLARHLYRDSGMDAYTLSPHLLQIQPAPATTVADQPLPYRAAGRDAIISYSRARYARPRAEVEAEIARLNGWPSQTTPAQNPDEMPGQEKIQTESQNTVTDASETTETVLEENEETGWLRQRLLRQGIMPPQVDLLFRRYDPQQIQRQLDWLPYRNAKSPARYLLAAIQGDYAAPSLLHRHETKVPSNATATDGDGVFPASPANSATTSASNAEENV